MSKNILQILKDIIITPTEKVLSPLKVMSLDDFDYFEINYESYLKYTKYCIEKGYKSEFLKIKTNPLFKMLDEDIVNQLIT